MRYYVEQSLSSFEFWGGARDTAQALTMSQLEQIEAILEDCGDLSETDINDLFWFEPDRIAEWLGYDDFEALQAANEVDE